MWSKSNPSVVAALRRLGFDTVREWWPIPLAIVNFYLSTVSSDLHGNRWLLIESTVMANKKPEDFVAERDFAKEFEELLEELSQDEDSEEIISEINGALFFFGLRCCWH